MPFDAGVDGVTEGVIAGVNAIPLAPRRRKAIDISLPPSLREVPRRGGRSYLIVALPV